MAYKGYAVFTFKLNGVSVQFMALTDVKRIVKEVKSSPPQE